MGHVTGLARVSAGILLLAFATFAGPVWAQGQAGEGFPRGNYTPFGYLDNPYHTLWLNHSGMIRSAPPLGFRFRDHEAVLQLAVEVAGKSYADTKDLAEAGLHSSYHTKNIFTYAWRIDDVAFEATYFLVSDSAHGLNCELTVANHSGETVPVRVRPTLSLPSLDLDHYTAHVRDNRIQIQQFAAGPVHVLKSTDKQAYFAVTDSPAALEGFVRRGQRDGLEQSAFSRGGEFAGAAAELSVELQPGERVVQRWTVTRDVALEPAVARAESALRDFEERMDTLRVDDQRFWRDVPRLTGDWPEVWMRGIVYDWETLRMNVRRPIGVYRHHWDGMQVMIPRSVLAETAIDMLAYSYAKPNMATEVLYGIFADALAPNVPCLREDGSVNMVSETGEQSGTAPSWCLPSLTLRSLYARTGDDDWRRQLLPHLEEFVSWWAEHRIHEDGAYFFDNSWESGQDQSARFLVHHRTGGTSVRFMEPVELHAAMADFAGLLAQWNSDLAGEPSQDWHVFSEELKDRTARHWVEGRFRDFDRRSGEHTDVLIAYHLTPFVFGLTGDMQNTWLRQFSERERDDRLKMWTDGAPSLQVLIEALWAVGKRPLQAELIASTLHHVYSQWDRRSWATPNALPRVWGHVDRPAVRLEYHPRVWAPQTGSIDKSTNPGVSDRSSPIPMPGVASEFWRDEQGRPTGMENYGWGATLPMHLIRGIIGYRDGVRGEPGFRLAPSIPASLAVPGKRLGMSNLHYRNVDFDVSYQVDALDDLTVSLSWRGAQPVRISILDEGRRVAGSEDASRRGSLTFPIQNYAVVDIRIQSAPH